MPFMSLVRTMRMSSGSGFARTYSLIAAAAAGSTSPIIARVTKMWLSSMNGFHTRRRNMTSEWVFLESSSGDPFHFSLGHCRRSAACAGRVNSWPTSGGADRDRGFPVSPVGVMGSPDTGLSCIVSVETKSEFRCPRRLRSSAAATFALAARPSLPRSRNSSSAAERLSAGFDGWSAGSARYCGFAVPCAISGLYHFPRPRFDPPSEAQSNSDPPFRPHRASRNCASRLEASDYNQAGDVLRGQRAA